MLVLYSTVIYKYLELVVETERTLIYTYVHIFMNMYIVYVMLFLKKIFLLKNTLEVVWQSVKKIQYICMYIHILPYTCVQT